jgi:hypothetical protein
MAELGSTNNKYISVTIHFKSASKQQRWGNVHNKSSWSSSKSWEMSTMNQVEFTAKEGKSSQ